MIDLGFVQRVKKILEPRDDESSGNEMRFTEDTGIAVHDSDSGEYITDRPASCYVG